MKTRLPIFLVLCLALSPFVASSAAVAQLQVDVTTGQNDPLPIAVTRLVGEGDLAALGDEIAAVVEADLERSGLFEPIDSEAFIQQPEEIGESGRPRFGDWRTISAHALVTGWVSREADGRIRVGFRLWDVLREGQLRGLSFRGDESIWRRIAHRIADAVYERLTGETGYFDTQIVYISETGPASDRTKRLAIMDQDGANHMYLTDGSRLVLTPRFSPSSREITYMAYRGQFDHPRVYLLDLDTGRKEILGDFPGMTFAPRFSPDGGKVVMSLAIDGNSDIYAMDLSTRWIEQLTTDAAIDTSPSYSPDGAMIAFTSDRGRKPQIYVMKADGGEKERITFGDGSYSTPVWSPRGDLIAFTRQSGNRFHIGVMNTDGTDERLISAGFLVEGPTWAPNGRVLMFTRETPMDGGKVKVELRSIDLTGFNERPVETPLDGSDPAWSPLIP